MTLVAMERRLVRVAEIGTPGSSNPEGEYPVLTLLGDMGLLNDWQVQDVSGKAWEYGPGYTIQGLPRGDANPTWWDGSGGEINSTPWPNYSPWILACPGVSNSISNVRLQIKGLQVYPLRASLAQWVRAPGNVDSDLAWCDEFNAVASESYGGANRRTESDGHASFALPSGSHTLHGGAGDGTLPWPTDVIAMHVRLFARLVPQTVGAAINLASSRWMLQLGLDWKEADWGVPSPGYWAAMMASRCKRLTDQYQLFTCTNVRTSVMGPSSSQSYVESSIYNASLKTALTEAELLANLPPGFNGPAAPTPTLGVMKRGRIYVSGFVPAPTKPTVTTTSLTTATAGIAGSQSITYAGDGLITATATGLPPGAALIDEDFEWDATVPAGTYVVTITPTSSTAGVGTPRTYTWQVQSADSSDPGAWAPHLRTRRG